MTRLICRDNTRSPDPLPKPLLDALMPFAGVSLEELCSRNPGLLVFPHCLNAHRDGIRGQAIFQIRDRRIQTGNVLGFIGINGVELAIHSRFDRSDRQYFLHHMLKKVCAIKMLELATGSGPEPIWDFLPCFFPYCLKRAVRQGVFKAYRSCVCNDLHWRGRIDVAQHLKNNLPFTGSVACRGREHSPDNVLMQLIRHTVELIRSDRNVRELLAADAEIRGAVELVIRSTPTYRGADREQVIAGNLRPVRHPYFTEYSALQKLCLQILRHDRITFGGQEQQIHGIVFDGAWLWEEYLATFLIPRGFEHPENRVSRGRKYLYRDNRNGIIYPDFIRKDCIVDAKYKALEPGKLVGREDRFQMIAYLHVFQAPRGYFAYPTPKAEEVEALEGTLNGHGGEIRLLPFHLPEATGDFIEFQNSMAREEQAWENFFRPGARIASADSATGE